MKIAIDGPAGAGKSTVARRVAEILGIIYVDTGAMYRALTLKALDNNVNLEDQNTLAKLAETTEIDLAYRDGGLHVFCDGSEVTEGIRTPEVSRAVSRVASCAGVRSAMVRQQQALAGRADVIMDGRDITHCVLPDAEYKFYFTASLEERARRRGLELEEKGHTVDYGRLAEEIRERDRQDMEREVGALQITPDAVVLDTSKMSEDQVINTLLNIVRRG